MSEEEITTEDVLNVTGSMFSTMLDYLENSNNELEQLQQENQELKKQLEYLRSGEYYNQLRFERDMLQDLVDKKEISKEDKEFIDMTHRNTILLEENKQLKQRIKEHIKRENKLVIKLIESGKLNGKENN